MTVFLLDKYVSVNKYVSPNVYTFFDAPGSETNNLFIQSIYI